MLSVEDWAEIRRLRRAEQMPIAEIARVMAISRNTVRAALASDNPPKYERAAAGSVADVFEPRIRELLRAFPSMPATVIAERIGWPYSVRTLSGKVAQWRSAYLPPDPVSRTSYAAGEPTRMDHLGVEVETTGEVTAATARLAAEGLATATEEDTACCYAVQDKVWVTGPGDEPWEVYVVKGDADVLDKASGSVCYAPAADAEGTAQPAGASCC